MLPFADNSLVEKSRLLKKSKQNATVLKLVRHENALVPISSLYF